MCPISLTQLLSLQTRTRKEIDIIFVGRLEKQKRLAILLHSLADTHYTLSIYGEGSLKLSLMNLAKELNVSATFYPPIPNSRLPRILNQHRIFVLPSSREGLPKALMEAMSCELACVVCDSPGLSTLIYHLDTGYICKGTSVSIREGIDYMFAHCQDTDCTMRKNAREKVVSMASVPIVVRKVFQLINELHNE